MQTLLPPPLPTAPPSAPVGDEYYRVDPRRLTWLECWRIGRSPLKAFLLWLGKFSGQSFGAAGFPVPRSLAENLLAPQEVPPAVAGAIELLRHECEALGFSQPLYYGHKHSLAGFDVAGCLLRCADGETVAVLVHARSQAGVGQPLPALCALVSPLADGRLLVTSNGPARFNPPPGNDTARRVGASAAVLHTLHARRLEACRARGNPPRPVRTFAELSELWHLHERRAYECNVARGLYVPLTSEEVARQRGLHAAKQLAAGSAADGTEAEETRAVLDALHRRDHPAAASGVGGLLVLVISLAVFALSARLTWNASFVAMIVGVLLFHETGHYLAMRAFGFRNLRMFFVPFLGAVVTGLDPRAPGWQRAIVVLAGPLPGLVLAAAVILGQKFLPPGSGLVVQTAFVALGINGFNLLPFLPLDGGRVLQETLFCRHPLLCAGFTALAGGGLVALGLAGFGTFLIFLGALMLGRVASTWRVGQAASDLRAGGLALTGSGPEETVRPEAVPAVLAALKRGRPSTLRRAVLANEAVAAIDLLRARPPGLTATATLLAAYAVAWALALGPTWPLVSAWLHRPAAPMHQVHPHATPTPAPDDGDDDA